MGERGHARRWALGGAAAAAVLALVLVTSLSGRAPSAAHAFPVLDGTPTITPSQLSRSLAVYGVDPDNDGFDVHRGYAVSTPWGTGYVLANPGRTFICVVAPGLGSDDWGASCATRSEAATRGTGLVEYAYDSTLRSARLIAVLPRGAVVATLAQGGVRRRVRLHRGVLAVEVTRPQDFAVTIAHHTRIVRVAPGDATP